MWIKKLSRVGIALALLFAVGVCPAVARGNPHHHYGANASSASSHHHYNVTPGSAHHGAITTGAHDASGGGGIHRSPLMKAHFRQAHPCPATGKTHGACPGYVIDHVVALKRGGADAPYNMQWQTTAAAKAKDKIE